MNTQIKGKAVAISSGYLTEDHAKTTHGLIRFSQRFEIVGVIDEAHQGQDAGQLLDGQHRNIPVFANIKEAQNHDAEIKYAVIGVATAGGIIPDAIKAELKEIITAGVSIVNGLHQYLNDIPELVDLAAQFKVQLVDIRKPRPRSELQFWSGEIYQVDCPIIAVLGTDCAIGKRTTARWLVEQAQASKINAQMIFTGQTGWLQEGHYGFILDSTVNDFISGEIEAAIVRCWQETQPDLIFIEGQSALQNPSGPCGSEFIISGRAQKVILQHAPDREYYEGCEDLQLKITPLEKEIKLIEILGGEVIAVCLNCQDPDNGSTYKSKLQEELKIPVILPLQEGVEEIIDLLKS